MTGIVIPDGGTIGSTSDTDALAISSSGVVTASASIQTDTISEKTSANGVSIDGLKVKDYSLMYGSNIGLTLDSNGSINYPNNIWVGVHGDVGNHSTANAVLPFNAKPYGSTLGKAAFDTTSHEFTVPKAGSYLNIFSGMSANSNAYVNRNIHFELNGSPYAHVFYDSNLSTHDNINFTTIVNCSASETLRFKHSSSGGFMVYMSGSYTFWWIIYLG